MLKGISPYLSPDSLKALYEMGHGDEILLADAHFPGQTLGRRLLRADGMTIPQLLEAILPLFELDRCADALIMMQPSAGESLDPAVEADVLRVVCKYAPVAGAPLQIDRYAFYERARSSYAVLMTGELRAYGNLILRKGITPV
jgi:L-fucose mutarotase